MIAPAVASPGKQYSTGNNYIRAQLQHIRARISLRNRYGSKKKTFRGCTPIVNQFIGTLNYHPKAVSPEKINVLIENTSVVERNRYKAIYCEGFLTGTSCA